jgi:hypothetical protein
MIMKVVDIKSKECKFKTGTIAKIKGLDAPPFIVVDVHDDMADIIVYNKMSGNYEAYVMNIELLEVLA